MDTSLPVGIQDAVLAKLAAEAERRNCSLDALVDTLLASNAQAERALRESEARYRGIVESQIDLVCQYTPEPKLTFVNDAYCQFFGKTREQLIGQSFVPLVHAADHPGIFQRLADCLIDPKPRVGEVRTTINGQVRWVQWVDFGITDEHGKVVMLQAVGRDITPLKQAESALRTQEEHYRLLFQRSPLPIWVYDVTTKAITDVNEAAIRGYGYSREEFLSITATQLQDAAYAQRFIEAVSQPNLGAVEFLEWRHQKRDGTTFPVEIFSHEIILGARRMRMVVSRDMTERKQLEDQRVYAKSLEMALAKDREMLQLKERFISIVSHEFRTPLTIILTLANILRHYSERLSAEARREKLDKIVHQVKRMSSLLDDVLAISRGNAQHLEFKPVPTEIVPFCEDIIANMREVDGYLHPVVLITSIPTTIQVPIDRRLVEHMLANLLANALKYSEAGKTVSCRLTLDAGLVIEVNDQGMGIPEVDQERLFEPFHRAENARAMQGTGLGLSIAKQSADVHGGTISFESRVGHGSTFTIRLPL
jgi:PAS domain S-box-containing protein